MAKATLSVAMKGSTRIEVRLSGKRVKTQTQRFRFPNEGETRAAMFRAAEWVLKFAQTGQIPGAV